MTIGSQFHQRLASFILNDVPGYKLRRVPGGFVIETPVTSVLGNDAIPPETSVYHNEGVAEVARAHLLADKLQELVVKAVLGE